MVYQTFCAAYQASPTAVYRPAKHFISDHRSPYKRSPLSLWDRGRKLAVPPLVRPLPHGCGPHAVPTHSPRNNGRTRPRLLGKLPLGRRLRGVFAAPSLSPFHQTGVLCAGTAGATCPRHRQFGCVSHFNIPKRICQVPPALSAFSPLLVLLRCVQEFSRALQGRGGDVLPAGESGQLLPAAPDIEPLKLRKSSTVVFSLFH